jgi:hypothetical protein
MRGISPNQNMCPPARNVDATFGGVALHVMGGTSLLLMIGCGAAPSVSVFGSFFPAWLICVVIGVVLTVLSRVVLVATGLAPQVGPAIIVYPALAALWSFATWLVVFGG